MLDDLERITKLWKDGALTEEEFNEQKSRLLAAAAQPPEPSPDAPVPRRRGLVFLAAGVLGLFLFSAAFGAVVWLSRGSHGDATDAANATASNVSANGATTKEPEASSAANEAQAAAQPEAPTLPYVGHLTCNMNGDAYPVYMCLAGSNGGPSGTIKIRSEKDVKQYSQIEMVQQMQDREVTFDLTKQFEVLIQAGGDEYRTLRFEVTQGDKKVYSDEANRYNVIKVSS